MAGLEVGTLVGSEGAFVAEPILVEPGAYGVGLFDVVGVCFFAQMESKVLDETMVLFPYAPWWASIWENFIMSLGVEKRPAEAQG